MVSFFFNHQTKVSISCQGMDTTVNSVYRLYSVPDFCELVTPNFSTISEKQTTVDLSLSHGDIISNIVFNLSTKQDKLKLRRVEGKKHTSNDTMLPYYILMGSLVISLIVGGSLIYFCWIKINGLTRTAEQSLTLRHVSSQMK